MDNECFDGMVIEDWLVRHPQITTPSLPALSIGGNKYGLAFHAMESECSRELMPENTQPAPMGDGIAKIPPYQSSFW